MRRLNWAGLPAADAEPARFLVALAAEAEAVAMLDWGAPGPHYEDGAFDLFSACRVFAERSVMLVKSAGSDVALARDVVAAALPRIELAARVAGALEAGMKDQASVAVQAARNEARTALEAYVAALRSVMSEASDYAEQQILPHVQKAAAFGLGGLVLVGALALALLFRRQK